MRIFDYVYYRVFSWFLEKFGKHDGPEWSALLVVILLVLINALTVLWVIEGVQNRTILTDRLAEPLFGGTTFLVAVCVGYFIWYKEPNRSRIINRYKSEPPSVRASRTIYFRSYLLLTILLPILTTVFFGQY